MAHQFAVESAQVRSAVIDADEFSELRAARAITSVPRLVVTDADSGAPVADLVGSQPATSLLASIGL